MTENRIDCGIFNGRHEHFGYHLDLHWQDTERNVLVLDAIRWLDPESDVAGLVDLVSRNYIAPSQFDIQKDKLWLLVATHCEGDSFSHEHRAQIIPIDLFDETALAEESFANLSKLVRKDDIAQHFFYRLRSLEDPHPFSFPELDGIFSYLDGAFLLEVKPEHVQRYTYR